MSAAKHLWFAAFEELLIELQRRPTEEEVINRVREKLKS